MILKFNTRNPRRNLPVALYRKRGESNFVGLFEKIFLNDTNTRGVGGRQFALSGFGIADFVWINFTNLSVYRNLQDINLLDFLKTQKLTAFEMKLTDWKRALYQAYRYTYFADHSIVVLPLESIENAYKNLNLFEELKVGLWGFDRSQKKITELFTPHNESPKNQQAKEKAIDLIGRKINFRMFAEQF